jgi:hypothetical protein
MKRPPKTPQQKMAGPNKFMSYLLRSSLFHRVVSRGMLLVTYLGPRSGRSISFPTSYAEKDDVVIVPVGWADQKRWWRNFRRGYDAELRIRGKDRKMHGTVMTESDPGFEEALEILRKSRKDPRPDPDTLVRFIPI